MTRFEAFIESTWRDAKGSPLTCAELAEESTAGRHRNRPQAFRAFIRAFRPALPGA